MTRLALVTVALLLAGCSALQPDTTPDLYYHFDAQRGPDAMMLRATGDADGTTEFVLGVPYGANPTPHDAFTIRRVQAPGGEASFVRDGRRLTVTHPPGGFVEIDFSVDMPAGSNGGQGVDPDQPGWHFLGYHGLILPADAETVYDVALILQSPPEGWTFVSSVNGESTQAMLANASIMGGPLDVAVDQDELEVALLGEWTFSAEDLARDVGPLIAAQGRLWGDQPGPFTVTLSGQPGLDGAGGYNLSGSGVRDGFAAWGTSNVPLDLLGSFLAHEVAHNWMPRRIGQPVGARGEMYWFTEGMTEFLAQQARVEAGRLDADGLADVVNANLEELALSPVRTMPNARAAAVFWDDPDAERLPYLRGFLLATKWDAQLKEVGHGGLVQAFRDWAADGPHELNAAFVAGRLKAVGVTTAGDDIARHIDAGQPIPPAAHWLGACYRTDAVPIRPYDVGFDVEATFASGRVTGVNPDHNAFAAGLRDGMGFVGKVSGGGGARDVDMVLSVTEDAKTRAIAYRPLSVDTVPVAQFVPSGACD